MKLGEQANQRLAGKKVIVTGASSGFGRGIALACAAAGADVALIGRDQARLQEVAEQIRAGGTNAFVCVADFAEDSQTLAAVAQAQTALGVVDVLVNNAGMNVRQRSIQETEAEQWRLLLDVNLTAAFLLTKAVLLGMIARQTGTIINVASRAALRPHLKGGVAYSTSKIGLDSLTQVTNEEVNPHNVRACLLCPGEGNTPLLDRRAAPPPPEARLRMIQPADIGEMVVVVASMPQHVKIDLISMWPTRS
jgi:NADP-dependent 3-hydroxy acid dehydrogenase YdfG